MQISKSLKTKQFILETVAPLFNKYGYHGTSLSVITEATGLTKGALYGNFENKEELALSAFEYSKNILLKHIINALQEGETSMSRMFSLINFYKSYNLIIEELGGCPIVSAGADAKHNNFALSQAIKEVHHSIEGHIAHVIEQGQIKGEFKLKLPAMQYAKQFYTILNGGVISSIITSDSKYFKNSAQYLEYLIQTEFAK
ncbi:MAG: TetR family transcriptional regulator [Flavobacteriaceae bacterium]|nr:TetR family transcriptional regulator [Flavobacteriaceae bacterium]